MYSNLTPLLLISLTLVFGTFATGRARRSITLKNSRDALTQNPASREKGSISVHVFKEDGQPAAGMDVFVDYGRRGAHPYMFVPDAGGQTDKQGYFHVAELLPGEYIISTSLPNPEANEDSLPAANVQEPTYYKTELVYYKDTLDRKDARSVWVKVNEETVINMIFLKPVLHRVSGTVINRDGKPLPGAELTITRKQTPDTGPHLGGVTTTADEQGDWSFDVPDGVYLIGAWTPAVERKIALTDREKLPMPSII